MKKILSITFLFITSIMLFGCSSDTDVTVKTYFGKWEAQTVRYKKDGKDISIPYSKLEQFSRNEEFEIFTDKNQTVRLDEFRTLNSDNRTISGHVNDDFIVFGGEYGKRKMGNIEVNSMELLFQMMIDQESNTVIVTYKRIGDPRDLE